MPVSTGIHVSRRATHNSYVGAQSVGAASNAPSEIAISPSQTPNSGDPQDGQKCRATVAAFQFDVLRCAAPLAAGCAVAQADPHGRTVRDDPDGTTVAGGDMDCGHGCSSSVRVCHYLTSSLWPIKGRRGISEVAAYMPPDLNGLSVPCASRVSRDHPLLRHVPYLSTT
jgi:hypothetical protein